MVVGGFDITEQKIRARQVEPNEFQEGSFRTIRLAAGVQAIIGKKKGETSTSVQSILFDKKQFTPEQAKVWLKRNKEKFSTAIDMEDKKMGLFSMTLDDHLDGHLPPLSPSQIERLLEMAGPAEDDGEMEPEDMSVEPVSKFLKRI